MDAKLYFENDPWSRAVELMKSGQLGDIKMASVQAVCVRGTLEETAREWQLRLDGLLGQKIRSDTLRSRSARSIITRYEGPIIGRIFADEGSGGPVESFEVLGSKGFLLCKPQAHALSIISVPGDQKVVREHPYATSLCGGKQ